MDWKSYFEILLWGMSKDSLLMFRSWVDSTFGFKCKYTIQQKHFSIPFRYIFNYRVLPPNIQFNTFQSAGRGALAWEGGTGMCCGHDPLFQASRCFIAYQFTINLPLMCPPCQFLEKVAFSTLFLGKNFSSQDANLSHFLFPRPHIFQRKSAS